MVTVSVDLEKCTGCGTCIDTCPVGVFELQEIEGKEKSIIIAEEECIVCRACEVSCPEAAIEARAHGIVKIIIPFKELLKGKEVTIE